MFDDIRCDAPLPAKDLEPGSMFQSHSLFCSMERFTITGQGRLIHHHCRHEEDGEREVRPGVFFPQYRRIPVEDIDMEYHGDIRLYACKPNVACAEYVARFTHGALEWIKPFSQLPLAHQRWFYSKD